LYFIISYRIILCYPYYIIIPIRPRCYYTYLRSNDYIITSHLAIFATVLLQIQSADCPFSCCVLDRPHVYHLTDCLPHCTQFLQYVHKNGLVSNVLKCCNIFGDSVLKVCAAEWSCLLCRISVKLTVSELELRHVVLQADI